MAPGCRGALVILSAGDEAEASAAQTVSAAWAGVRFSVGIHPHQAGEHAGDLDAAIGRLDADLTAHGAVRARRDRPRLSLRFLAARRPAGGVPPAAAAGARARPAGRHPHPRSDRRHVRHPARGGAGAPRACSTASPATSTMARTRAGLGAWLSFAGIVTFPKAAELREVARMVPADRFLVETDSPYLAPVPHPRQAERAGVRGQRGRGAGRARARRRTAPRETSPLRASTANFSAGRSAPLLPARLV